MTSFLEIESWDGDSRTAKSRIPVADVALPAGYAAKATAIITALTNTAGGNQMLPDVNNVYGYRVVIDQAPRVTTPPTVCDVRNTWEFLGKPVLAANGTKTFKFQVSGRYIDAGNVAPGSRGFLVNDANVAFQTLQTALLSSGVDMKTPYNLTASAALVGGRALTSKRKTVAGEGGLLPGQTGAISYIDLLFRDFAGRTAVASFPVAPVALPAGYGAKITAVCDALEDTAAAGTALVVPGSIKKTRVIIESALGATLPVSGDIGDVWQVQAADLTLPANVFRFALPCRNTDYSLTSVSSDGKQIDTSNPGWLALVTALNAAAGVDLRDPKVWANASAPTTAFALTSSRKIAV